MRSHDAGDSFERRVEMSDEPITVERGGIQVIARAAAILRELEGVPEGLSLAEIVRGVGLPRSTVYRIVTALADEGLVITSMPTGKVRLGPAVLQLAATTDYDIKKLLRPYLADLNRDVEDTVDLGVLRGGSVIFVDQIPGKRRLIAVSAIGERFALHCTANGKALLAQLSPEEARRAIEKSVREHPEQPLRDEQRLWQEIEDARNTGLAFDREENSPGIGAVGFAMRDGVGALFAISVPMPIQRFKRTEKTLIEKVQNHRNRIKSQLGA